MVPPRPMPAYPGASPGFFPGPGMYDQPSPAAPSASFSPMRQESGGTAPPESIGLSSNAGSGQGMQRWQEAYADLEQDKRKLQNELRTKEEDMSSLAREAQALREQIRTEQERRQAKINEFTQQLEGLERDNKQLQMKLMKVQMQDSAKLSDVTTVKKEVVAKTMELEKMMREFQQTHQERLYARVQSVTSAMLAVCQKQDTSTQIQTPAATTESP